ncbi:chemotaxis protein CheW [Methylobacterium terrae]|uniref:Chemotaxis protein CheW n=1 Tax=Methylobacterium terrae TaxID=2202827 RepID=A0A2U8WS21_9HYPH|nr:chemotaxis protein CheW [Methylobacterium terrae]AWN48012.1 chemotaxis protein CheW [Methylobacterium terrae]
MPGSSPAGPQAPGEAALSAARIDEILDARTRALASRGAAPEVRATRALLLCRAGAETVGIGLEEVAEVFPFRPCTPVPGAPAALVGLTGRGGLLVSVVDLAAALGAAAAPGAAPAEAAPGHVVTLRRDGPRIGLKVDRVLSVAEAEVEAGPDGLGRRAVAGYARAAPQSARQGSDQSSRRGSDRADAGFAVIDVAALLAPLLAGGRPNPA